MDILGALYFGPTSDLYKRLVVSEQKVDELETDVPASVDPSLFTVLARVKNATDAVYVRDQILGTFARVAADGIVPVPGRLQDAKSNTRYSFARTIDSSERVAAVLSAYTSYKRSYQTVNNFYRSLDSLTAADPTCTPFEVVRCVPLSCRLCGGSDDGQVGVSQHDQGDVPIPTVPLPHFIFVETDLTFRRLETFLDRPADHGDARCFQEGRRAWGEDVVSHDLARIAQPSPHEHAVGPAIRCLIRERQPGPVINEEAFRTRTD
jgi:hypothetical protein